MFLFCEIGPLPVHTIDMHIHFASYHSRKKENPSSLLLMYISIWSAVHASCRCYINTAFRLAKRQIPKWYMHLSYGIWCNELLLIKDSTSKSKVLLVMIFLKIAIKYFIVPPLRSWVSVNFSSSFAYCGFGV